MIKKKNPVAPETDVSDPTGTVRPAVLSRQAEADVPTPPDRKPEHGKVMRSLGQRADERQDRRDPKL